MLAALGAVRVVGASVAIARADDGLAMDNARLGDFTTCTSLDGPPSDLLLSHHPLARPPVEIADASTTDDDADDVLADLQHGDRALCAGASVDEPSNPRRACAAPRNGCHAFGAGTLQDSHVRLQI